MKLLILTSSLSKELADYIIKASTEDFSQFKYGTTHEYLTGIFDNGAMAFVSYDDFLNINGVLLFYVSELLPTFRGKKVAIEHMWHSTGSTGMSLFKAFEDYAQAEGCETIIMSAHFGNPMTDKIMSLYERNGYSPCEITYTKEFKKRRNS